MSLGGDKRFGDCGIAKGWNCGTGTGFSGIGTGLNGAGGRTGKPLWIKSLAKNCEECATGGIGCGARWTKGNPSLEESTHFIKSVIISAILRSI